MSVVVELRLPPDGFALGELFSYRSDVRIELECIVPTGEATMPFFWVVGDDPTFVTEVADESVGASIEIVDETGNRALCRVVWPTRHGVHKILTEQGATLLDAEGSAAGWSFQVRFPDHETTTQFREACDDREISYEVRRIYSLSELPSKQHGLTDEQREALVTAFELGYFQVPRQTSLSELAELLEISPQATSGRLRRGLEQVLEEILFSEKRGG
ncbi:helix-turn-helix domain-containing protein [Haladaptatus sp. NG-SE-30]